MSAHLKKLLSYIYDNFISSLGEDIVLNKEKLLLLPIIADASCWKNGYFVTLKNNVQNNMDIYPEHYFKNPIRNKVYDHHGTVTTLLIDGIPVGEESIQFHSIEVL